MRALGAGLVGLLMMACGSDDPPKGPVNFPANPCATRGSTYLQSSTEISGDCGPIPDQIVNINPDGTITQDTPLTCDSVTQEGCTARDTGCKWTTSEGVSWAMTFETAFKADGSSATGIEMIRGSGNGQTCTSTYNVSMTRR